MMDLVLEGWVSGLVELSKLRWMFGSGEAWRPGRKLRLLFAGYNGTRNTGSDLRVEEILRQVRRILGAENLDLTVMSQNFDLTRGYFGDARQIRLPDVYPPFLFREVRKYDGVVACEGSMFKSKFANALTVMLIGSLGIAAAENKLSLGFGAEAGDMDPLVEKMCRRYCRQSLVITRSAESQALLAGLGVPTELGTDTAWTFEPLPPAYARGVLRAAGWDERKPILVVCPINPFWWPVKPSVVKAAARTLAGAYRESHYRSLYFHTWGAKQRNAYRKYLAAMAGAAGRFAKQHGYFPVVVAMERLDRDACREVAERLGGAPVFTSDDYDMYQIVSLLREAGLIVSSRFHAIVCSMPALVPSAGVTMDERIRNLMRERGHRHLLLTVDDPELEPKLEEVLETLRRDAEAMREAIGRTVVENLKLMARMGVYFEEQVQRHYPEFPFRRGMLSWEDYLPPFGPGLRALLQKFS